MSVEDVKAAEKARREGGKETVAAKRELEVRQRERDVEARKREKREFELERAAIREKLAQARQAAPYNPDPALSPAEPCPGA
jgi:hypothetical protein